MKLPSDNVLKMVHQLAKQKLCQIENPNFLFINVLLCTAAVITKEYLNNLNEKYTENPSKAKAPRWIKNIEEKMVRLERTTGHLIIIVNCKNTGIFTNHQKKLKEKFC